MIKERTKKKENGEKEEILLIDKGIGKEDIHKSICCVCAYTAIL